MISRDGRPTGLGEAFAHYGRIFKTLHILQVLHDEASRRMIASQKNLHESRHALARKIRPATMACCGSATGKGWRTSSARSGLCSTASCSGNTIYMDKARAQRQAAGRPILERPILDEILAGLSPLIHEHLNFSGRYPFPVPVPVPVLDRPLRDPNAQERRHLSAGPGRTRRCLEIED